MNFLFIDANIYLRFYDTNNTEFRKLLKSLTELKDQIFITDQIVNEVNRNKLNVFKKSIEGYLSQANFSKISLPEHLDKETTKISEWNKKRKELEKLASELMSDLKSLIGATVYEISSSEDNVSIELQNVFNQTLPANSGSYSRARIRKELGNPPGKVNDPLGDQLNWTQVLENIEKVSALWIVSADNDYYTDYDKELFLNPLLLQDLKKLSPQIKVFVFAKLSEALSHFSSQQTAKIESLPEKSEMDKISNQEPSFQINSSIKFYGGGHSCPISCPNCKSERSFDNGAFRQSRFGGLTFQFICSQCNYHHDTGDFWD